MKTIRVNFKNLTLSCVIMTLAGSSFAQGLIDSLSQDDSKIISSIAPYAAGMRSAILDVSQYPQALVKLERTQARTSQSFQDLIAKYPREEQEKFYQAARFPELTNKLADGSRRSPEDIQSLLKDYPENVQQQLTTLYNDRFEELVEMNDIYQSSQRTLEKIISRYPVLVQDDFKKVVGSPDVMNLLTDNIDLTVSLGEAYKNDPAGVTGQLDNLNKQLTAQNEKDLADYRTAVQKDPNLQAEMKKAADEFASQYDQGNTNPAYVANNYYNNFPYQYWYGYPYWYSGPMWYATPFYYQTGFYYGPGGGLIVAGLPSLFYANWFFGFGYSRYPGLYHHYNAYYNVHRTEIINRNVYRGFNGTARNHFSTLNREGHGRAAAPGGGTAIRHSGDMSPTHYSNHINQMNVKSGNFNNNAFTHYHANSFHSAGWQHVRISGGRGRH